MKMDRGEDMKYEVGMKVVSMTMGEGEVIEIRDNKYCLAVRFDIDNDTIHRFTEWGYSETEDVHPSIYPIGTTFTVNENLTFNKGEVVETRNDVEAQWLPARFIKKSGDRYKCTSGIHADYLWKYIRKLTNAMGEDDD